MYRIFCESYQNYLNLINDDSYRRRIVKPFELIVNIDKYKKEKKRDSELYKKVSDLIYYMKENIEKFPRLKAFLWTLDSRNIDDNKYNISREEDLEEQTKIINSILKLAYWF